MLQKVRMGKPGDQRAGFESDFGGYGVFVED